MVNKNSRVIFDNVGGVILQLDNWAHYYDDPKKAAEDYFNYLNDNNTDGWQGHEPELLNFEPTLNEIRNGGYKVFNQDDITKALVEPDFQSSWYNVQEFVRALKLIKGSRKSPLQNNIFF